MTLLRYRLRPIAEVELGNAAEWYEQQRPGLGFDFRAAVLATFNHIAANPRLYAVEHSDIRLAPVDRFPTYVVCYRLRPGVVVVVSVFHTSRDPASWQERA